MTRHAGFSFAKTGSEPLYKQLFDQIVERIASRAFPPGYKLPPTRELSRQLSVNRNTVVRAYADLEAAGFVTSTVGRGTFVIALREEPAERSTTARARESGLPWSSLISGAARSEVISRAHRLTRASARSIINLAHMHPSVDLMPDRLVRRCADHVLGALGARALEYAPVDGIGSLRELIVADLARQGVPSHADDILVTTGSQQALDLIARALVTPGDKFLVDPATYPGAISALVLAGAHLIAVPTDDEGPDLMALERLSHVGAKGFYLMPNCNNPTGSQITAERRRALVDWSRRAGVPLIEDDYGSDLWLDEKAPPPAMRSLDGDVVYIGTFSKKLMPAIRIGFIACPKGLKGALVGIKRATDVGTSLILQHILAEFLGRGYLRAHLNRTVPEYRARRDVLTNALARHAPPGITWERPGHGLVLWLPLPAGYDPESVFEEAYRRGVLIGPSSLYAPGPRERAGIRLAFCGEPRDRIALGGRRLGEALHAVGKQRSSSAGIVELQAI